ncbi:MAG: alkaline phosphatase D family protein, partial [Actinomycetota bacterium]
MSVFLHAVASGDPLADRVVLWTRVTSGEPGPARATWRLARDRDLRDVVAEGETSADPANDMCIHVDVGGLEPATTYFYGFEASGEASPVGRTRTLPGAGSDHLRIAMVSCAKYNAGYFNAYGRIAERELDFVLHLGDYIYEAAQNPPASQTPPADIGRVVDPLHECVTLEDYRTRYAHYHLDPDVQALHLAHPLISTVDCHEFADGAWRGGSVEHREDRDGPWAQRMDAAWRARWEWLPARRPDPSDPSRVWRTVPIGGLADLFLIDTRTRRDEPAQGAKMLDPSRSQLGPDQRGWLLGGLESSTAAWRLLANSSVMGHIWDHRLTSETIPALLKLKMIEPNGRGPDPDQWDGYPHERDAILRALGSRDAVVLSGDVHIGLALELKLDPSGDDDPVACELVTTSLTSQNVDDKMEWAPRTKSIPLEEGLVREVPHIKWCEFDSHGYVVVDVDPERVLGEWWFVETVLRPSAKESLGAAWKIER